MASKKHFSDVFVYDSHVKTEPDTTWCAGEFSGDSGTVCVTLRDDSGHLLAFERWACDKLGYMSRGKFAEALAYSLGLSSAYNAIMGQAA